MAWLADNRGYDRARVLARARSAAARGKHAKAIDLYSRVAEIEPENTDVLRRIAGQRARAGEREDALRDAQEVATRLEKKGFVEQAIGVYRELAAYLPIATEVWEALADLELSRGRAPDAVDVLVEGRKNFMGRRNRYDALVLLRRAHSIDPTNFVAGFDLSGVLLQHGERSEARQLLLELESHTRGHELRRLRGRLFRLSPGPRAAYAWLRALL